MVQKNYGVGRSGVMYDGARELEMEPSLDWGTVGWCWITVDGPVWLWDCLGSCFMGMENGGREPRAVGGTTITGYNYSWALTITVRLLLHVQ